eukprot:6421139-Amphidinium_carterae.1
MQAIIVTMGSPSCNVSLVGSFNESRMHRYAKCALTKQKLDQPYAVYPSCIHELPKYGRTDIDVRTKFFISERLVLSDAERRCLTAVC